MKKYSIMIMCFIFSFITFAQTVEVVKTFPDGQPIKFGTSWDSNEGAPPGAYLFQFCNRNTSIFVDSSTREFFFLDKNWNVVSSYLRGTAPRSIAVGKDFIALGATGDRAEIFVLNRENALNPVVVIKPIIKWWRFSGITAGKYILKPSDDGELLSWEVNMEKGSYIYRDQKKTMELLQSGLAEQLGLKEPYASLRFTSRDYSISKSSNPVVSTDFEGYSYDEKKLLSFKLQENSLHSFYNFIGTDTRGLYYFSVVSPYVSIPSKSYSKDGEMDNNPGNATYTNPDKQLVFAIADPWQKKVVFRVLPKGYWNPPANTEHGLLGSYPFAIHPDGSIYFFDGDEKTKSFILKRVINDWWQELGFDKKQVGIVNDNRVRIRSTPSTSADILGYVYEMEHALVLEKGTKQETIGGQTSLWYKIKMWDNREGWVFGAFLDF